MEICPSGGKGSEIAEVVGAYLTDHGVIDSWKIVGGDSTPVNTGVDRGCFVLIEGTLARRLMDLQRVKTHSRVSLASCFLRWRNWNSILDF